MNNKEQQSTLEIEQNHTQEIVPPEVQTGPEVETPETQTGPEVETGPQVQEGTGMFSVE